jgi:uncharacterized protein YdhG (YjbR/CyaY superfamily)
MNNHFDQFEKAAPSVRAAYDAILKASRELGKVREAPKKTSIHLMRETTFAGVTVRREALILTLKSDDAIDSERVHKALRMSAQRYYNEIRVRSPREVNKELRAWIAASYELSGKPCKMPAMLSGHKNFDEYVAQLTPAKRAALKKLRRAILDTVPGAEECISYQMPAFRKDGKSIMCIAAMANHISIFPGAGPIKKLAQELKGYETSKGTIRIPIDRPMPAALLKKVLSATLEARTTAKRPARRAPQRSA